MWFYHCHAQLGKIHEVGMGIFSYPSYFGQNSIVTSEKSQGHQCGITQFMTHGVLHVLASDLAFQVVILYSNICPTAAESALYSPKKSILFNRSSGQKFSEYILHTFGLTY